MAIILFDGVCNLCNRSVQFILLRDPQAYFQFAALQSDIGQKLLKEHGLETTQFDSVVLLDNGNVFQKSGAALRIAQRLSGGWKCLYGFMIIPYFLRDWIYGWVARNRYRWFGKQEEACMLPRPEWKARFLS